ncbi:MULTISPECIES: hypothetical protein [Nostocales]|jgi:hypothetical protein|uniref:Uncharacterized protein n=1 Tax=Aphanizomenon flos-aquae FACHB-1040 TaxID=2692887 RepID=A0ABR8C1L2_APHFL|nr:MULTISPECIES: hypothetical protein [Nostocales]QSV71084.1 MAG: hypothetical protein HEQ20_10375 [Aphanizomenon flos-aquae KM1D3_PB]ALB41469.1 hypothetical protein AA650_14220 [Anabaena sp. WA102]MBD2279907.1 hypothetical protein [Aphanizomenon flos-aquae FACHB-1040]MTJ28925.1 hypothetical protein [Aphanizomenon sp. UHCC 0183]OBQ20255.1 MAG: hypothetical protein AN486_07195 [Anabaena sp. AL93]
MSVDKYNPHLIILPEDDHNRQIANGFKEDLSVNFGVIQTLRIAGGWKKVLEEFKNNHISSMRQFPQRNMLLLIDFDAQEDRFSYAKDYIPEDLRDRVFILGVKTEPRDLKEDVLKNFNHIKSLQNIGEELAKECAENRNGLWGHDLLIHNKPELERMILSVKPFLFLK